MPIEMQQDGNILVQTADIGKKSFFLSRMIPARYHFARESLSVSRVLVCCEYSSQYSSAKLCHDIARQDIRVKPHPPIPRQMEDLRSDLASGSQW